MGPFNPEIEMSGKGSRGKQLKHCFFEYPTESKWSGGWPILSYLAYTIAGYYSKLHLHEHVFRKFVERATLAPEPCHPRFITLVESLYRDGGDMVKQLCPQDQISLFWFYSSAPLVYPQDIYNEQGGDIAGHDGTILVVPLGICNENPTEYMETGSSIFKVIRTRLVNRDLKSLQELYHHVEETFSAS